MSWQITDAAFDLVVAQDDTYFHGYTHRHEWIAYGEGLTASEEQRVSSLPLRWEIRRRGGGRIRHYLELDGRSAPEGASTAVRIPSDTIIVLGEIAEERWPLLLRAFDTFAIAPYPKHFDINVPMETLANRGERTIELEQFLAGSAPAASFEEISVVFSFGSEPPEGA